MRMPTQSERFTDVPPEIRPKLEDAIARCDRLPVLDRALQRALAVANQEEASIGELVEALEADPNLCANILHFSNCAANTRRFRAKTIRQAVAMVGRQGVRRLALESVACRFFERAPGNGRISRGQMHLHAVQVARLASACASRSGISPDAAHLAGLLHDCGRVVMPLAFGDDPVDKISLAEGQGVRRASAEREAFGVDHARAGALFASSSGLGDDVVAAIGWHHGGEDGVTCPDGLAACVQLGNVMANALTGGLPDEDVQEVALSRLELPHEALDELAMQELTQGATGAGQNQSTRVADIERLERLASTDDLTGVANRRHWIAHVRRRLEAGDRGCVLVCDLDFFKQVNDCHGHAAGDRVLTEVAEILSQHGFAGRLGGDEFAIWVDGDPAAAVQVAEMIVSEVSTTLSWVETSKPSGISVGLTDGSVAGGGLSAVLDAADRALYRAKAGGRGRLEVAGG
jgi:diguanylate cyclase (GGDEF)-like protein/putative nucleotidyltransferase with HDIG domain